MTNYKLPKIIIPTCNNYIRHIEALQQTMIRTPLLNQSDVIVIGDKKPEFELESNWTFVKFGIDSPAERWAERIGGFLQDFEDEYFVYGCDDSTITFFDEERYKEGIFIMDHYKEVGRIALMAEGRNREIREYFLCEDMAVQPKIRVHEFTENTDYRLSLGWSMYRKDCFLEFCEKGMTAWDFEKQSVGGRNKERLYKWRFLTFLPEGECIDASFCRRKSINGIMADWDKGYYGHDLKGEIKQIVKKIHFK